MDLIPGKIELILEEQALFEKTFAPMEDHIWKEKFHSEFLTLWIKTLAGITEIFEVKT